MRFRSVLFILSLVQNFRITQGQGNSITFSPSSPLCIGEEVQMVCFVTPPNALPFTDTAALMTFNNSVAIGSITAINTNTVAGIDTTRYTADFTGLTITTARPGVRLTITDYQASDGATNFSCHGQYSTANGGISPAIISGSPRLANAPLPSVLTISQPDTSCSIILTWSPPVSDRPITYSVYRDGVSIPDVSNTTIEYTENDLIDVTTEYAYSVVATSCAGDATSDTVSSVSIGVPFYPVVIFSQTATNCCYIQISWSTPSSDRPMLTYSVYRNDTFLIDTTDQYTDSIELDFNTMYKYSVVAISCAGNSTAGVNSVHTGYILSSININYNGGSGLTIFSWVLDPDSGANVVVLLTFSYHLSYVYTQNNMSYYYLPPNSTFNLTSNIIEYNVTDLITPHNFTGDEVVETNITVCLQIIEQFEQTIPGVEKCYSYSSAENRPWSCPWGVIIGIILAVCCCLCCCGLTGVTISVTVYCVLKKKGSKDTSDTQEPQDQTYSQVNKDYKKPKVQPKPQPPVKPKQTRGNYADLDLEFPLSDNLKKPEPVPETLYTAVQSSSYRSNH